MYSRTVGFINFPETAYLHVMEDVMLGLLTTSIIVIWLTDGPLKSLTEYPITESNILT